jgi:hypothetical protein
LYRTSYAGAKQILFTSMVGSPLRSVSISVEPGSQHPIAQGFPHHKHARFPHLSSVPLLEKRDPENTLSNGFPVFLFLQVSCVVSPCGNWGIAVA